MKNFKQICFSTSVLCMAFFVSSIAFAQQAAPSPKQNKGMETENKVSEKKETSGDDIFGKYPSLQELKKKASVAAQNVNNETKSGFEDAKKELRKLNGEYKVELEKTLKNLDKSEQRISKVIKEEISRLNKELGN